MKRRAVLSGVVVAAMLMAVPALAANATVRLTSDNRFVAANTSVNVGDTVTFVWEGGFHDVVFADGQKSGSPVGDVGTEYKRTFSAAGTYSYVCTVHEALGMKGTVVVAAAGGGGTASSGTQNLPSTGPEPAFLSALGLVLVASGVVWYSRMRREED